MGEFIAVAVILVAAGIIIWKINAARKGKRVTGCCDDCTSCSQAERISGSIEVYNEADTGVKWGEDDATGRHS